MDHKDKSWATLIIDLDLGFSLAFLAPVKGILNGSAYQKQFEKFYASIFVGTVWERPFSLPGWLCPSSQNKFHKGMLDRFSVEKLDWPA